MRLFLSVSGRALEHVIAPRHPDQRRGLDRWGVLKHCATHKRRGPFGICGSLRGPWSGPPGGPEFDWGVASHAVVYLNYLQPPLTTFQCQRSANSQSHATLSLWPHEPPGHTHTRQPTTPQYSLWLTNGVAARPPDRRRGLCRGEFQFTSNSSSVRL